MNFLEGLKKLNHQTIHTLDQNKKFEIQEIDEYSVHIFIQAKNTQRKIPISEIKSAFDDLGRNRVLTRIDIESKHSPRNPAYVAAILSNLDGVRFHLRPITLYLEVRL